MGAEPDEIRREIAATRAELAADVDRLADRTSPSRIIQRRTDRMREKLYSVRERVMGTPSHAVHQARYQAGHAAHGVRETAAGAAGTVRETAAGAADSVRHGAQQATELVREAPEQAMRGTQGNPLAAGLIAFGAGLLAAALIPATEAEQRAAQQVKEQAGDMMEPVKEAVRESAQQLGQEAKQVAQEAVGQVRDTAGEAAKATGDHARDQAHQVTETARSSHGV
ncbi:DUF3618 domain-containing protein [Streptosporangium sandarakinum]|uniref:ElaB/YqjD/DUF883 family membrane-anchored ribosome-binding protein n=1 Tax=Streptosporangium sandarakinum TaxID=1260955 RepID=A0A852V4F3_9ACTN|nr:DUF3618 domain-containing protein [Streptosporangium sandarakinum]NYF40795.1 ElaB/YqjD/DUF883 family membrane-anchored ribosome-binding protein [Streptosporangium sandarakinum]